MTVQELIRYEACSMWLSQFPFFFVCYIPGVRSWASRRLANRVQRKHARYLRAIHELDQLGMSFSESIGDPA